MSNSLKASTDGQSHVMSRFFSLFTLLFVCGCTYHGKLNTGFFKPSTADDKLPIRANLVCSTHMESSEFNTGIYIGHSVYIKTHPALKQALTETCLSLFDAVEVTSVVNANVKDRVDVILLPNLEMRGRDIKLSVVVKNADTHETIQQYQATELVQIPIPVAVHCLGGINIVCCGLLLPVYPINAQLLGVEAKADLESHLSSCLSRIAQDIRNDRVLLTKVKSR